MKIREYIIKTPDIYFYQTFVLEGSINLTLSGLSFKEFKEIEPRVKFETRLKYGWFHLKLYPMFQDLSRRSIETGFGRLKLIKFGHCLIYKSVLKALPEYDLDIRVYNFEN